MVAKAKKSKKKIKKKSKKKSSSESGLAGAIQSDAAALNKSYGDAHRSAKSKSFKF